MRKALGSLLAVAMIAVVSQARAEEEFDVRVSKGAVEVVAKGAWHVNHDGPWSATIAGTKYDKSKWTLSQTSAKVSGLPAGEAKLKIYVCSGDKCKNAEKTVTVQ